MRARSIHTGRTAKLIVAHTRSIMEGIRADIEAVPLDIQGNVLSGVAMSLVSTIGRAAASSDIGEVEEMRQKLAAAFERGVASTSASLPPRGRAA